MSANATPRRISRALALSVGIAVGIVLPLLVFVGGGGGVLSHAICVSGSPVSNATVWTPFSLTNAPYLGSTVYRAHFANWELFGWTNVTIGPPGSLTGNVSTGYFETQNWTLYSESNRSLAGPGLNRYCESEYTVLMSHTQFDVSVSGEPLQGLGNASNVNEPTTFTYGHSGHSSAIFANGFTSANAAPVSTCGTHASELNFTSTSFEISMTFSTVSGPVSTIVTISSAENYTYLFPANGGTWQVDDLQNNPGLVGPGLAFRWTAC